jgi:glycosyltransferase involved in cell wall biosynthesis
MSKNSGPQVSIGMPVFNGERYIRRALDSILSQSFQCFELIISDNASTDRTHEICLEYVAKDSRVRYYRNKQNIGAAMNHNRVFELSESKYFKWAAHDDVLAPEFLSSCLKVLEKDQSVVLCHSKTGRIDQFGKLVGTYGTLSSGDSSKPHKRFGEVIAFNNDAWVLLFGLIRSNSLRMTRLFESYIGSDRNLLAEISLAGRICETPDVLFFRREHSQSYTNKKHNGYEEQLAWWTRNKVRGVFFPYWRRYLEYFKSVRRLPLTWSERQLCYAQIFTMLVKQGWILLGLDFAMTLFRHSKVDYFHLNKLLRKIGVFFLQRGILH